MADYLSAEWLWLYSGVILILIEILTPGFVIFFFGLSAITVAGITALAPDSFCFPWQLGAFSFLAIAYLLGLRRFMKKIFFGKVVVSSNSALESEYIGRGGCVTHTVSPGIPGRVMIGDAEWDAVAATELEPGVQVTVIAQNNLTLTVQPITK